MKLARAVVIGFLVAVGCTSGDIIDNTVQFPDAMLALSTTANAQQVRPGQLFPLTVSVQNITLVEPTGEPPPELAATAAYLVFTLDDESSTPLLATAETDVVVTIPPSTTQGTHTIICRVFQLDGTPTASVDELTIGVPVDTSPPPFDMTMDTSFPRPAPPPPPQPDS